MQEVGVVSRADQLALVEGQLRAQLPELLRDLYMSGEGERIGLLVLATGLEDKPNAELHDPGAIFEDALRRNDSVLGHLRMNASARSRGEVWPEGLLVVEDAGCAIYRAVDLANPGLRMIEYEHLDPVDDPDAATSGAPLAYGEPTVPRALQHRFVVVAESLEEWVRGRTATPQR